MASVMGSMTVLEGREKDVIYCISYGMRRAVKLEQEHGGGNPAGVVKTVGSERPHPPQVWCGPDGGQEYSRSTLTQTEVWLLRPK